MFPLVESAKKVYNLCGLKSRSSPSRLNPYKNDGQKLTQLSILQKNLRPGSSDPIMSYIRLLYSKITNIDVQVEFDSIKNVWSYETKESGDRIKVPLDLKHQARERHTPKTYTSLLTNLSKTLNALSTFEPIWLTKWYLMKLLLNKRHLLNRKKYYWHEDDIEWVCFDVCRKFGMFLSKTLVLDLW
jgi:hypothetical protein